MNQATEKATFWSVPSSKKIMGLVAVSLFAGILIEMAFVLIILGNAYYSLGSGARSGHPLQAYFGPGGPIGSWLGVIGISLMLAMLTYSLRKKFPRANWLGPLPGWLRFHIICGVMGPILIIMHIGLVLPTGLAAIGFWCMVLVALSGLFGRYVYGHFPRTAAGLEMDLSKAQETLTDLRAQLVADTLGGSSDQIVEAVKLARDLDREVKTPLQLVLLNMEIRRRKAKIKLYLKWAQLPENIRKRATDTLIGQLRMKQSLEAWAISRKLFRYWHLFHLPLAKAMYIIIAIHIVTAFLFGGVLDNMKLLLQ